MTAPGNPPSGRVEVIGRIMAASNSTFLAEMSGTRVVYKPVSGERPLWDFPDGDLASREVAAFLVSETLGWNIVPLTWMGEGPAGPGMLQLWQDADPNQDAVDLVPASAIPLEGWRAVFEGFDAHDRPVSLLHEDSVQLRRMAVFDSIVNNADRKGGHILAMPGGHRYGVDHGLTFHAEHKLRTVLWGWLGEPLDDAELDGVTRVLNALDAELGDALTDLITQEELIALTRRCDRLIARGTFPSPRGDMPAVPWPVF